MAEPTRKSTKIEGFLDALMGGTPGEGIRTGAISADKCIGAPLGCGSDASSFRDEISRREYRISGFCQDCQDNMFGA